MSGDFPTEIKSKLNTEKRQSFSFFLNFLPSPPPAPRPAELFLTEDGLPWHLHEKNLDMKMTLKMFHVSASHGSYWGIISLRIVSYPRLFIVK